MTELYMNGRNRSIASRMAGIGGAHWNRIRANDDIAPAWRLFCYDLLTRGQW